MIYNLDNPINFDVVENGVYESLRPPKVGESLSNYLDSIYTELKDCPYLYASDYNLLIPVSIEILVCFKEGSCSIYETILNVLENWWKDENRL